MYNKTRVGRHRKLACICIAALMMLQSGLYLNIGTVYAETDTDAYIVIAKNDESIEKLKEEHSVLAENGDALTLELTGSEAVQVEADKDIICVEKDFTIETEAEAGEDMVKPLSETWNREALNVEASQAGSKVKIAVIDSGIDVTDNIAVKERKNFIKDTPVTTPLYEDFTGHGTSVASLIMGTGTDSEVVGTGSNIELYSARVLDENKQAPISSVVEAIYWAMEKDVNIINISFGTQSYSEALKTAIDAATDKGILVVAAVGNRGTVGADYPAAFENVLSVGSVNAAGEVSDFSAKGKGVDVVAPGEAVLAQANFGEDLVLSGTSLSAPQVSGIAARLWSKDLSKPATFIKTLIKMSAKHIGSEGSGYGLVDYEYAMQLYDEVAAQFEAVASGEQLMGGEPAQPFKEDEPTSPVEQEEGTAVPPATEDEPLIDEETQEPKSSAIEEENVTGEEGNQEATENLPLEEEAAVTKVQEDEEVTADMAKSKESEGQTGSEDLSADELTEAIIVPDINSVAFENMAMEQIDIAENSKQVADLSDPIVDGSWTSSVHTANYANQAMKDGATYPDRVDFLKGMTSHPEFHGYSWHSSAGALGTGDCNFMANYKFLVKIAAAYGRGDGYTAVARSEVSGLSTTCYNNIRAGIQGILDADKVNTSDQKILNQSDTNQRAFVLGLAMHVATDTFAHSSFFKPLASSTWQRITHPDADDVSFRSGRYRMAIVAELHVVSRYRNERTGYDTCSDFHNTDSGAYSGLDFRITKIRTFAEATGYSNSSVLSDFGKLQSQ